MMPHENASANTAQVPLHVVILAAGQGSRMKSDKPKVLQTLCGQPMIFHVLNAAAHLQPAQIHVVYGHLGEALQAGVAAWQAGAQHTINWVLQAKQGGTGDAVRHAMPGIPEHARVLVLYGDAPALSEATLRRLMASATSADANSTGFAALVADVPEPGSLGRVKLSAPESPISGPRSVLQIIEAKDADAETLRLRTVNTGVLCASAALLRAHSALLKPNNVQGELYLTDIFASCAAQSMPATAVFCSDAQEGFGANDAWELAQLERYLQLRQVRALCVQGLRVADPLRVDVRGSLQIGRDVEFDVNVLIEGQVSLGDGVRIGAFCRIQDCQLAAGTVVHSHCELTGVITTGPCKIGPFARLRPGTELAAGSQIGNFVETKKARFGPGSKASHLSYLGDATIGSQVNIGAGTITCNYDGVNKFETIIEDGAFIGSNSNLVAPIRIGAFATIGAGSTLNQDAPAGQLTLARSKAITLPAWKRPKKR